MGNRCAGNGGNYAGAYNSNYGNQSFEQLLKNFIGQTVIVFTTSGGASGCGFEGILLEVNNKFIRLSSHQGTPPANPLSETICGVQSGTFSGIGSQLCGDLGSNIAGKVPYPMFNFGAVCDIPIDKIAAFCHNAI